MSLSHQIFSAKRWPLENHFRKDAITRLCPLPKAAEAINQRVALKQHEYFSALQGLLTDTEYQTPYSNNHVPAHTIVLEWVNARISKNLTEEAGWRAAEPGGTPPSSLLLSFLQNPETILKNLEAKSTNQAAEPNMVILSGYLFDAAEAKIFVEAAEFYRAQQFGSDMINNTEAN
jgi:hypothetical protein